MRIGSTVVRVKNEFNLSMEGDIRVIKAMKVYNRGIALNLEGDKPDTFHSANDFRLIEDVDMPCLQAKLEHVADKVREAQLKRDNGVEQRVEKRRATMNAKKGIPTREELLKQVIEEEEFDFPEEEDPLIHIDDELLGFTPQFNPDDIPLLT